MENFELPADYIRAEGPEGLSTVLDDLLERVQKESEFSVTEYYILYQHGDQRSLIKVDVSAMPFEFWYYDLLGRPITRLVKRIIAGFLWEKCGEKAKYLAGG